MIRYQSGTGDEASVSAALSAESEIRLAKTCDALVNFSGLTSVYVTERVR